MTARRLFAFGGLVLAGAFLVFWSLGFRSSLQPVPSVSDPAPITEAVRRGFAGRRADDENAPVRVSTRVLDFGQVPIDFPAREMLYLLNKAGVEIRVMGSGLGDPFRTDQAAFEIDPHASGGIAVVFDPRSPGLYEQRLRLTLDPAPGGAAEMEILIRGRAVVSPLTAGLPVPPRPDEEIRRHQAQQREAALERAKADLEALRDRRAREDRRADDAAEDPVEAPASETEALSTPDDADPLDRRPDEGARPEAAVLRAAIAAFGVAPGAGKDLNDIPAPIPEGETTPELPPADDQGQDADDDGPTGGGSDDQGDDGPDDGDQGNQNEDDGPDDEAAPRGLLTIAPNSTILVYSSREPFLFQSFPLLATGSSFVMDGRMIFPNLSLAFGQNVGLDQWGNIQGTMGTDGSVEMNMVLRLYDPGGNVLDLPMRLTTGMAMGYSAEGRLMFANGIPRDPVTGNVKLVGITNVPLGQGSSIDKAPIYLEILARLQM